MCNWSNAKENVKSITCCIPEENALIRFTSKLLTILSFICDSSEMLTTNLTE